MSRVPRRSSSIYSLSKSETEAISRRKIHLSSKQLTIGVITGIVLSIVTITLQCIAYFTPHWKEISPNTHSLYVGGIDALIRTESLVYFNSVHRYTRQSYGLFQRCEYPLRNLSKLVHEHENSLNSDFNRQMRECTKNFLPSYKDEQFNECHSLQYYRFCSKTSERIFDIGNDYLRATFNILSSPERRKYSASSCDCRYPKYIKSCQVLGIIGLIFLFFTALLLGIFPFLKTRYQRLKIKCFAVLSSIIATLFLLINLSVVLSYLEFESIEYLTAIEQHYRSSEIYKLSQDVKYAIDRFKSSINIQTGYSTKLAWLAVALSIVDGILIMITCKVKDNHESIEARFTAIPSDESYLSNRNNNDEYQRLTQNTTISQLPVSTFAQPSPSSVPIIVVSGCPEQSSSHTYPLVSCLKRPHSPRIRFDDKCQSHN